MFVLKKFWCRIYQMAFRIALPFLPYRESEIIPLYKNITELLQKERSTSLLIVTDEGIVKNNLVSPIEELLTQNNVKYLIYDKTQPNPTVDDVESGFELYMKNNCDTLIAIGGGSSIDCAKAIGARIAYPNKSLSQLGGKLKIKRKIPTLIAIPTTAGTGSEVTVAALVTEPSTHKKYALISFPLIPKYAVLDATLTYSLPPHLTASTGMDALTHAVEAYIGRSTTKKARKLAEEAVQMIFENIEKAYTDGKDHVARENMLYASYKAGIAFSMSYVGYIHAISHSISGRYGTPHGLANAVIMPYVLEGYGKSAYKKLYRLGLHAGVCNEGDSYKVGAEKFIRAIRDLNDRMNIPNKLDGIEAKDIPQMSEYADKEANPLYPVPELMDRNELEKIYYKIAKK